MSIYTEKNPIKILIADDHEILRAGLRKVISVAQNMDIIAEAEDGLQAIKLAEQYQPTVVLLDILMPKLTGIEAVPKIKQVCPYTFIIIFTAFEDINHIEKALKVGADGYISKGVSPQFLIEALNNVVMGQKVYSKSIIKIIRDGIITNYSQTEENVNLTQKEKEVLHYLADGCSSREIAKKLNISVRTVETHRYNLMNKLELTNAAQLIRFAILHTDN
ncbi:MAG TPA: response regulator transcription factor [Candidatus Kapabacteria bacterium]|nr:response regulator transcription factor [Candidatus Kapabacteria bacterium]